VLTASPSNSDGGGGSRHLHSAEPAGTVLKDSQVCSCIGIDSCLPAAAPVLQPANSLRRLAKQRSRQHHLSTLMLWPEHCEDASPVGTSLAEAYV